MEVHEEQLQAEQQAETHPKFVFPHIHDNPVGWGPCVVPEQFKDTPYQPFSKDDRLGKVNLGSELEVGLFACLWCSSSGRET